MSGFGPRSRLGIRYSAEQPEDHDRFHRDLGVDFDVTRRNALKSPGFVGAHSGCERCVRIFGGGGGC